MIFLKSLKGFGVFKTMKRQRSKLLRFGKFPVKNLLFGAFIYLERRLIAVRATNIYFFDSKWKIESGFGLRGNGFLNGLLLSVFLVTILIGLGTNKWP